MNNIFIVEGKFSIRKLLIGIIISGGTGILSAFISIYSVQGSIENYRKLKLPLFAPSVWVLELIGAILFFIMSISVYRIWMIGINREEVQDSLLYYAMQLILSLLWCVLFLRFGFMKLALINILALILTAVITSAKFYKLDKTSAVLMLPFVFWCLFIATLNYTIVY